MSHFLRNLLKKNSKKCTEHKSFKIDSLNLQFLKNNSFEDFQCYK